MPNLIEIEREHRLQLWNEIIRRGGPKSIAPGLLRQLGIYAGQAGIWTDKARTSQITDVGITVSVKHTGRHYPDDLSDTGVIYHYPVTKRPGQDKSEVAATKETHRLRIPLFVIIETGALRDLYLGWVKDWDDEAKQFLIEFSPPVAETKPLNTTIPLTEFQPYDNSERGVHLAKARPGQQKFRFEVIKRYGPKCAFCDIDVLEALDAIHIISKANKGSDDARNGLVLCATHHRILDSELIGIEPQSLAIKVKNGCSPESLYLKHHSLAHLREKPDQVALNQSWNKVKEKFQ